MNGWRLGTLKLAFLAMVLLLTIESIPQTSKTPGETLNPGPSLDKPALDGRLIEGLPLYFEVNKGQVNPQVKLLSRGARSTIYLTPSEVVLQLSNTTGLRNQNAGRPFSKAASSPNQASAPTLLRMKFEGGRQAPVIIGEEALPGKSHYFIGNDASTWRTNILQFARGRYEDVYPGVDVVFYGNQRRLEFDFIIAAGTDPNSIKLAFEGADQLEIDGQGNLQVKLGEDEVLFHRPYCYQGSREEGQEIDGRFKLLGRNSVGFEVDAYDPAWPLIIDPSLSYSTYWGGSAAEFVATLVEDVSGNLYFCSGATNDGDWITVNPFQPSPGGGHGEAFVGKLNAAGTAMVYATYLGGSENDGAVDIAVDQHGNAYVVGTTASTDFPLKNPLQPTFGGGPCTGDAFVTKLNSDGSALLYSTYLGGSQDEGGQGIAVDVAENAYVMGYTASSNFPTKSPFQGTMKGKGDAFLAKLNASGTALVYSTYLGGSGDESSSSFGRRDVAVDEAGCACLIGMTTSDNFPLKNAFQSSYGGGEYDTFVTKFNPSGSALFFSTYLGGGQTEEGRAIAAASNGDIAVTGYTSSTNFPTGNPFQASLKGERDAFVTEFGPSGSLVFSTYFGGKEEGSEGEKDIGLAIAYSPDGKIGLVGETNSKDFPAVAAIQSSLKVKGPDAFVSVFSAHGKSLNFSTYLGGSGHDGAHGVAFNAGGNMFVGGWTTSSDFPVVNGFQGTFGGDADIFFTRIRMTVTGPVPKLTSISPTSATAGGGAFTLSVKGSDFVKGCSVTWDGSKLKTTFKSETELTSEVTAANLSTGNAVQVRVQNPGGGISSSKTCNVADYALSSSPSSVTVSAGQSATYTIKAASKFGTWSQSVSLSCSGLPSLCSSSFSSAGGIPGTGGVTSTLTIKTTAPSLAKQLSFMGISGLPFDSSWLILLGLAVLLLPSWRRVLPKVLRPAWVRGGLLILFLALFISCESKGGGNGNGTPTNPGTPKGTYTIKVSGQCGSLTRSIDVTLVVQ